MAAVVDDPSVDPLNTLNPLDLLPPEQLRVISFNPPERYPPAQGPIPVIEPINGFPSVGSNVLAQLDDDALIGGIVGGPGDDPNAVNVTGILSHDYGSDGAGTTLLTADGAILPVGFTASVNAEGTVLTIHQVSTNLDVLQISLSNTTDGSYTVTQLNSISQPAGGDENNLQFSINYVVTDGNGDSATGSFSIDVDDNSPSAQLALLVGLAQVDETVPSGDELADPFSIGTPLGVASTKLVSLTGSLTGADSAGATTEVTLLSELGDGADSGLNTTDGTQHLPVPERQYHRRAGWRARQAGAVAFALTIDNTGLVTVAQYLSLQHPDPTNPDDSLVLSGKHSGAGDGDGWRRRRQHHRGGDWRSHHFQGRRPERGCGQCDA